MYNFLPNANLIINILNEKEMGYLKAEKFKNKHFDSCLKRRKKNPEKI